MICPESPSLFDEVAKSEAILPSLRKVSGDRIIYVSRNNFGNPFASKHPVNNLKIVDFDNAVRGDVPSPHRKLIQPHPYRAPEVILGAPWSYNVDIWNFAVLVRFNILFGK